MNEPDLHNEKPAVALPWYRQRLLLLVVGSVIIALLLVVIAMAIYVSSGAAQLDISRPGYQSVQDQVDTTTFESFPSTGSVDTETIDDFLELYDKQTGRVDSNDVFSEDALADKALGIDAP